MDIDDKCITSKKAIMSSIINLNFFLKKKYNKIFMTRETKKLNCITIRTKN
jgi:hypothetical protein